MPMLLVFALSLSLLPVPAAAQSAPRRDTRSWYVAYEDAKKAIEKKDFQKALTDLQVAVERGPKPGRRVSTYGDGVVAFTPDYYAGLAYLGLRRYAEADAAFKSVGGLIVKGDKEYDQFLVSADTAAYEYLFSQAEQAMTKQQYAQAKQAATEARAHARGANVARLASFESKIDRAIADSVPAPGPRGTPTAPPVDPNPPSSTPANPPPSTPTGTAPATPTTTDSGAVSTPPANPPVSSPAPAPGPRGTTPPGPRGTTPPPASSTYVPPPSPAEANAIEVFYRGDYARAAADLKLLADNGALTPRGFFYLACSRAAMVFVGAAGESGLADARAALNTAGNASQFAADLRFISPRVRQSLGLER